MRNLPSIGGSDCHSNGLHGVFKSLYAVDEFIEEIRRGNCRGINP